MEFNATLIAQALAFAILIAFTVKFIWPPLMNAIEERQKKIADGLAAADNARKEVADAKRKESDIIDAARAKAQEILDRAHSTANQMVDQAKGEGAAEKARQLTAAGAEVDSSIVLIFQLYYLSDLRNALIITRISSHIL